MAIEDYLCLPSNVHASEIALWSVSALWFVWFVAFNPQTVSPALAFIFSEAIWANVFGFFAALHLYGVFFPALQCRALAAYGYSVAYFVWFVMVAAAEIQSLAVPTVFVLLWLAIYVAVRLSREEKESVQND
jgi:hypothetical protein